MGECGLSDKVVDENQVLKTILEGTAAHTGKSFFKALVKNLAKALHTKGAWVTEYLEDKERLRAIAFWLEEDYVEDYEFDIAGTPCERVIRDKQLYHIPENILELFPDDPDLEPFEAVSYLGAPLLDLDGKVLGHIAVQDTRPMPDEPQAEALFRIFADRAASELRRLKAEKDLREREEKLTRLFHSALDAIIEVDGNLNVTQVNQAACKIFHCKDGDLVNRQFTRYLSPESGRKLANLMKGLKSRPEGMRYLWIPGGLKAVCEDGKEFQAEATLSCYEQVGINYYSLVLRNVTERLEAEKRIVTLTAETEYLREEIKKYHNYDEIIGNSDKLLRVLEEADQVAGTDAMVLISGETGTGKELVARAIHTRSHRKNKSLIKVNCAAIPENLIESEFFGHKKGAFTGATEERKGRFELAEGGTIFLDEIGELPLDLQPKLLRVLQEGEFEPVGSSETRKVDVRVIAATNRDLMKMVRKGTFREDLYYRLHVFPIEIPPLRERGNDIILLAQSFIKKHSQRSGTNMKPLTPKDIQLLLSYDWPGNVRELQNVIERAVITSKDGRLNLDRSLQVTTGMRVPESSHSVSDRVRTARELNELERQNMIRALEASDWKISGEGGAAQLIGIPPTTFSSRMKSLKIRRPKT